MEETKSTKAVLLDMDGVLVDSPVISHKAFERMAKKRGFDFEEKDHMQLLGTSEAVWSNKLMQMWMKSGDKKQIIREFWQYFNEIQSEAIPLVPGAEKVVTWVQSSELKLGLVTNTVREWVEYRLERLYDVPPFDVVVTASDVVRQKPNPEMYRKAAKELGLDPGECIAVEDSVTGAQSAISSGCITFVVPSHGQGKDSFLPLLSEEYIFESMHAILKQLKSL